MDRTSSRPALPCPGPGEDSLIQTVPARCRRPAGCAPHHGESLCAALPYLCRRRNRRCPLTCQASARARRCAAPSAGACVAGTRQGGSRLTIRQRTGAPLRHNTWRRRPAGTLLPFTAAAGAQPSIPGPSDEPVSARGVRPLSEPYPVQDYSGAVGRARDATHHATPACVRAHGARSYGAGGGRQIRPGIWRAFVMGCQSCSTRRTPTETCLQPVGRSG